MIEFKGNIFKMGLRACRKKKYSFDLEEKPKSSSIRISKDVIYLNDFYNLLYEKGEKETIENQNPPKYFKSEKFYTMGPGIDFPLVMNYRAEEHSPFTLHASRSTTNYFYFLNGHGDVTYFADQNFTEEQIETYEYTPWGVLLTSASKNNLLSTSREFDFETGLQFNRFRYYNPNLGRFMQKDFIYINSNYYSYSRNNPVRYIDPMGLLPPGIGSYFWVILRQVLPEGCIEFCTKMLSECRKTCEGPGGYVKKYSCNCTTWEFTCECG